MCQNNMLKEELQLYLNRVYPFAHVEQEHTLGGQVHIRFELGGDEANGSVARVNQAVERGLTIFNDTFPEPTQELFILIYEYDDIFRHFNAYLHQQFLPFGFEHFYKETITFTDEYAAPDGHKILEETEVRIMIGKLLVKHLRMHQILRGIANAEMGFSPKIGQKIFFFDPKTDRAFHMYDDRGCYVWSDQAEKIREIYIKRNHWIVAYHRPEIEGYFRQ
jgi:hypothetical protein